MIVKFKAVVLGGLALLIASVSVQAAQTVAPEKSSQFVSPADDINYTAIYTVNGLETDQEAGLGIRLHFNSSLLSHNSSTAFATAAQPLGEITDDAEDYDDDPLTDKYFVAAWFDPTAKWPGSGGLPLELLQSEFTVASNFSGTTAIRLSATATAKSTTFQSSPMMICAKPEVSLSISQNELTEGDNQTANLVFQTASPIPTGCGNLQLHYQLSGTADVDFDYQLNPGGGQVSIAQGQSSSEVVLSVVNDDLVEDDEPLTVTILEDSNYSIATSSASLTLISEDQPLVVPEVNLSIGKSEVVEARSGSILIYVDRSTEDLSQPLEVFLLEGGTLQEGQDYHEFPNSLIIPAGKSRGVAVLLLKDDAVNEAQEALTISIAANNHYQRGSSSSVQLTLQDDEVNQTTSLTVDPNQKAASLHQIPTLGEWMMILMSLLLAGVALLNFRQVGEEGHQ